MHPNRMLQLARLVGIDRQTGRTAFGFLERLYETFQAIAARERAKGGKLGWNPDEIQRFRINNRYLAEQHGVSIRHVNRLLAKLQQDQLIIVHPINTWQREIDLSPLASHARMWALRAERQRIEIARAREIRNRAGAVVSAYVAILNILRAKDMEQALQQDHVLEKLEHLEKFHGRYAGAKNREQFIALEPFIQDAERVKECLVEVIAVLRCNSENLAADRRISGQVDNISCDVDNSSHPVDNMPTPVGNNAGFSAVPMTEMSPPHDQNVTQYTTTTSLKGVLSRRENGDPAFTASATRAGSGYEAVKTTEEKRAEFSSCSPDSWPQAWGLVLKLQPKWKRAFSTCSKPADFARWIARHHLPVAPDLIRDALEWHNPVDVVGALAVAASRDINEIVVAQRYREGKARAIYAAGMLRKQRSNSSAPEANGNHSHDDLRPWPSVFCLLDKRPAQSGVSGYA